MSFGRAVPPHPSPLPLGEGELQVGFGDRVALGCSGVHAKIKNVGRPDNCPRISAVCGGSLSKGERVRVRGKEAYSLAAGAASRQGLSSCNSPAFAEVLSLATHAKLHHELLAFHGAIACSRTGAPSLREPQATHLAQHPSGLGQETHACRRRVRYRAPPRREEIKNVWRIRVLAAELVSGEAPVAQQRTPHEPSHPSPRPSPL